MIGYTSVVHMIYNLSCTSSTKSFTAQDMDQMVVRGDSQSNRGSPCNLALWISTEGIERVVRIMQIILASKKANQQREHENEYVRLK
jgi:hypothetical protein